MEKKTEERFQSVNDMLIELKRLKRDTDKVSKKSHTVPLTTDGAEKAARIKTTPRGSQRFIVLSAVLTIIAAIALSILPCRLKNSSPIRNSLYASYVGL